MAESDVPRLTVKESELLAYFVAHPDRVLSREVLACDVWKQTHFPKSRTIDQAVASIRRKRPALRKSLRTVPYVGYMFSPDATKAS